MASTQARLEFVAQLNINENACDPSIPFPKPRVIDDVISKKEAAQLTEDVREALHVSSTVGGTDRGVRKSETGYERSVQ